MHVARPDLAAWLVEEASADQHRTAAKSLEDLRNPEAHASTIKNEDCCFICVKLRERSDHVTLLLYSTIDLPDTIIVTTKVLPKGDVDCRRSSCKCRHGFDT